jgi:hypothetical protein
MRSESDLLLSGRAALRCQLTDTSIILPDQFNFKTMPTSFMVDHANGCPLSPYPETLRPEPYPPKS